MEDSETTNNQILNADEKNKSERARRYISSRQQESRERGRSRERNDKKSKKKKKKKGKLKSKSKSKSKSPSKRSGGSRSKSRGGNSRSKSRGGSSRSKSRPRFVQYSKQNQENASEEKRRELLSNLFYFVFESAGTGVVKRLEEALRSDEVVNSTDFDINLRYGVEKRTLLHLAAMKGFFLMTTFLLSRGAKHDIRDWKDWTPILHAAREGHKDVGLALLEKGADTEVKTINQKTMLVLAKWPMVMGLMVTPKKNRVTKTTIDLIKARATYRNMMRFQLKQSNQVESSQMTIEEYWPRISETLQQRTKLRSEYNLIKFTLRAENSKMLKQRDDMNEALHDMRVAQEDERQAKNDLDHATKVLNQRLAAKAVAKRKKTLAMRNRATLKALANSQVGIVDAMTRLAPRDMRAQSYCCLALRCVTDGDKPEQAAKITFKGGVQAIVDAMRRFPSCVNLQQEASGALANLCRLNLMARSRVGKDGIQDVLLAMRFLAGDSGTQIAGCKVICAVIGALEEDGLVSLNDDDVDDENSHLDQGEERKQGDENEKERRKQKMKAQVADDLKDKEMEAAKAELAKYKRSSNEDRDSAINIIGSAVSVIVDAQRNHTNNPQLLALAGQAIYGFSCHDLIDSLVESIPGLCNGLQVMINITNDDEPDSDVADALRFSIAALSHLAKHMSLREQMVENGNDAHISTAHAIKRMYLWMKKIYKLDMDRIGKIDEDDIKDKAMLLSAEEEKPETTMLMSRKKGSTKKNS